MITELLLNGLFGVADILLGLLPEMEWNINTSAFEYAKDIADMIAYLLPMGYIKHAISFIIALTVFRISIAVIRTLKGFIPFLG